MHCIKMRSEVNIQFKCVFVWSGPSINLSKSSTSLQSYNLCCLAHVSFSFTVQRTVSQRHPHCFNVTRLCHNSHCFCNKCVHFSQCIAAKRCWYLYLCWKNNLKNKAHSESLTYVWKEHFIKSRIQLLTTKQYNTHCFLLLFFFNCRVCNKVTSHRIFM